MLQQVKGTSHFEFVGVGMLLRSLKQMGGSCAYGEYR
jgi:hypothetical protein